MAGHGQRDDVGSNPKLPLSQVLAGGSRQLKDWPYAPGSACVVCSERAKRWVACRQGRTRQLEARETALERLVDDGSNRANDQVPVFAYLHWNHGLGIQHILRAVSGINAEVVVVLHGNADETRDGVCAAFLNSSAFAAAAGVACVATEGPSGPMGVSCAMSGRADCRKTVRAHEASFCFIDCFIIASFSPN